MSTSTLQVGCALAGPDGVLASFRSAQGRRHAETLAPAIRFVCAQAGVALGAVDAFAVDVGPGLFTGLRVGLATVKGLAQALDRPVVGLTSLELLATAARHTPRLVVAVVDARRGEVYAAAYRGEADGVRPAGAPPRVLAPATLAGDLRSEEVLLVGDGARRYAELFAAEIPGSLVAGADLAHPSPALLALAGRARAIAGDGHPAREVGPLYLRQADAEINWEQRDGVVREPSGSGRCGA